MSNFIDSLNSLIILLLFVFFIFKFIPSFVRIFSKLLSALDTYADVLEIKAKHDDDILKIKATYNKIEQLNMQEELLRILIRTGCGDKVIQNRIDQINKVRKSLGINILTDNDLEKISQEISNKG